MIKYIMKRIFLAIIVVFLIATFTFWLSRAIPGGPFTKDRALPQSVIENLEKRYNLDLPVLQQYIKYIGNIAKFDFGLSYYYKTETVNDIIKRTFPVSCLLGVMAMITAAGLGIPLGIISALKENRWQDNILKIMTTIFISVPSFVLASLLMYYAGYKLGIFPVAMWGTWKHAVMPVLALAAAPLATITKYMRSSMLEVMEADYIRTARAKGADRFVVTYIHALKNAILPVLTILGPMFAGIICGSFVIEQIFAIPGLGQSFTESIFNRDYSMIMGLTIFYSVILVTIILIVDILYTLIDPRIKVAKDN